MQSLLLYIYKYMECINSTSFIEYNRGSYIVREEKEIRVEERGKREHFRYKQRCQLCTVSNPVGNE